MKKLTKCLKTEKTKLNRIWVSILSWFSIIHPYSNDFFRNTHGPSYILPPHCPLVATPDPSVTETFKRKYILPFTCPACQSPDLVGGKGAQLAILTSLEKQVIMLIIVFIVRYLLLYTQAFHTEMGAKSNSYIFFSLRIEAITENVL